MEEKLYETEFWAINFSTGELEKYISHDYITAINAQQASEKLVLTGLTHLRLTGKWFKDESNVVNYNEFYKKLTKPSQIVEDMDYDEFCDWLDLGNAEDIAKAIKFFERDGLYDHAQVMKLHLKLKYGKEEKNEEEDGEEES